MKALRIAWVVVFALCALILVARGAAASSATDSDAGRDDLPMLSFVLARYVDAVGGREALERLSSRSCIGREIDDRPYRGPVVASPVEAYASTGGRFLKIVRHGGGIALDGFDGGVGWHVGPDGIRLEEEQRHRKIAWVLDPQGPLRLAEYFPGTALTGADVVEGRPVYVVECGRDNTHYSLYFDVETGLLLRIGYYWTLGEYRVVDGVLLPFRIAASRKGGSTTIVFDEIAHNDPLSDNLFHMPPVVGAPAAE